MRAVVIGDVGWRDRYHLGDEAMTEVAIRQLRLRGTSDITLIAAEPDVSAQMYDVSAVPRIGFSSRWDRPRALRKLDRVTNKPSPTDSATTAAIAESDFVVIAGGGNLNSQYFHHVLDRVAVARLAEEFGKPLFVSSQTVGPMVRDEDLRFIGEIVSRSRAFGAREVTTYADLSAYGPTVVHTMDDGAALAAEAALKTPARYIVGSFTPYPATPDLTEDEYYAELAATLDRLSESLDADVLLIPNDGSFQGAYAEDQRVNQRIIEESIGGRIRDCGLMMARKAIAITEGALLSISSRYHPTVFAPMVGVPAIGIALSYYTSARMRGAMQNVGLQSFVAPAETWLHGGVEQMAHDMVEHRASFDQHMTPIRHTRRQSIDRWWDFIVESAAGGSPDFPSNLEEVERWVPGSAWDATNEAVTRVSDQLGRERVTAARMESKLADADVAGAEIRSELEIRTAELGQARAALENRNAEVAEAERELDRLRNALSASQSQLEKSEQTAAKTVVERDIARDALVQQSSRRSVRFADAMGRAFHRTRTLFRR
ncbi:polysaccharide pyruvyl transferase family protein [Agromyces sp. Marseille-Q5079]|uniref:polysaccharide pyruvyl transferase family protein n=1 Tax=Agromyces sp. Marseille-Q5079 TaxID=3439059 RepID=UPI003D9C8865